jgi:hypothetical protein
VIASLAVTLKEQKVKMFAMDLENVWVGAAGKCRGNATLGTDDGWSLLPPANSLTIIFSSALHPTFPHHHTPHFTISSSS